MALKTYDAKDVTLVMNGKEIPLEPADQLLADISDFQDRRQRTAMVELTFRKHPEPEQPYLFNLDLFQVRRIRAAVVKLQDRAAPPGHPEAWFWDARVIMDVRSRETGQWIEIALAKRYPAYIPRERIPFEVRRLVWEALQHEADECLLVDGQRIFDPHRNESRGQSMMDYLSLEREALRQLEEMNPQTATGQALDRLAELVGVTRAEGETDADLRERVSPTGRLPKGTGRIPKGGPFR